jgi:hypothetical protein
VGGGRTRRRSARGGVEAVGEGLEQRSMIAQWQWVWWGSER